MLDAMPRLWSFATLLALAACHGSAAKSPTGPVTSAPPPQATCAQVADKVIANLRQGPPETQKVIHDLIADHCTKDAWTETARACMVNANDHDAMQRCKPEFTQAQQDAIDEDFDRQMHPEPSNATRSKKLDTERAPDSEPAPPPPPAGPKGRTGSDPCDGGQ